VLFDGRELWGDSTEPGLKVSIEAFEPYLELA
jgi:nitrile hydratase